MKNKKVLFLTHAAMIAAIYVVLTLVFQAISFGEIQVRIAEALTILPAFTPAAIPGLFIGCIIGNIFGGSILPDIIFGSLATLIGSCFTYLLRNQNKYLAPLPPIISNTVIVPLVLKYAYGFNLPIAFMMLTVGIGEVISCGVLGMILYHQLISEIFVKISAKVLKRVLTILLYPLQKVNIYIIFFGKKLKNMMEAIIIKLKYNDR